MQNTMNTFKTRYTNNKPRRRNRIFTITRAPFKYKTHPATTPLEHNPRSPEKTGARIRSTSPDRWWNDTYIAQIQNGKILNTPQIMRIKSKSVPSGTTKPHHKEKNPHYNSYTPFIHDKTTQPEPIVRLETATGKMNVYCDTGANCDVITTQLLDTINPNWRDTRKPSSATLIAANNTPIHHIGTAQITLCIPGTQTLIKLNPYVTKQQDGENVAILGYPSMAKHNLVPIPGHGLMQTKQNGTPVQILESISSIRKINQTTPPNPDIAHNSEEVWTARPTAQAVIPAFHKALVTLQPIASKSDLNAANGRKILIRKCPCIYDASECETCINPRTSEIQVGYICNGTIDYQYDNTRSCTTFTLDTGDTFYISFEKIFDLDAIANTALGQIDQTTFDVNVPTNPYSDQECDNLFQATKEQITHQLRAICAEPESWSLTGRRPATLKLINHKGEEAKSNRTFETPIPFEEYVELNPCNTCNEYKETQCNIERIDCELRKYHRYRALPPNPTCNIIETGVKFNPHNIDKSYNQAVIGCHRNVNNHQKSWKSWFKYSYANLTPYIINIHDAPITEVSKVNLISTAQKITSKGISHIHMTNFKAFAISKNLLTRCFPPHTTIYLYESDEIQLAKPGTLASRARRPLQQKTVTQNPTQNSVTIEPGLPSTITPLDATKQEKEAEILTDDPQLKEDCLAMLEAHKEVFATSDNDCGTFIDPNTKKPFYFKIRLKDKTPVMQKTRFVAPSREDAATALIAALIDNDIIQRQHSPYNSQSVFVQKKPKLLTKEEHLKRGGKIENFIAGQPDPQAPITLRHCCDFVALNNKIEDAATTTLSPKAIITKLANQRSCATLDISGAYHCMMIAPEDRILTGHDSGCPKITGRLTYKRSVMGLKSSSTWLSAALSKTLAPAVGTFLIFADDILVYGKDDRQVLERLTVVIDLLRKHGWKLKRNKLVCFTKKLNVLGQQVSLTDQTIAAPRAALDAVLERPRPAGKLELKSFLGSVNWFGTHLPSHGQYSATLNRMCRKDNKFEWDEPQLEAYEALLDLFSHPQVHNAFPDYDQPFHIIADTSTWSTGFLLCQATKHSREPNGRNKSNDPPESQQKEAPKPPKRDESSDPPTPQQKGEPKLQDQNESSDLPTSWIEGQVEPTQNKDIFENAIPGSIKVISYHTHVHDERTARLSPHERESHGMILALATFFDLIAGCDVTLHTDSKVSTLITAFSKSSSKVSRWATLLNSFHWLKINWLSSKSKMLQLADWLSRPEAGHKEWRNKSITDAELKAIDITASKLKRNTAMTIKHHDYLLNWVCNLQEDDLQQIKDNSVYITDDGDIKFDTYAENKHSNEQALPENDSRDMPDNSGTTPYENIQNQESESKPEGRPQSQGSPTEAPKCATEAHKVFRVKQRITAANATSQQANQTTPLHPRSNQASRSLSLIQKRKQNKKLENNDPIMPFNVLTYDQADSMGILSPATQNMNGPQLDPPTSHYPAPQEGDTPGAFLKMCFDKSPHMKTDTLILSQERDPLLASLRTKCKNGPQTYGTATYFLHSNILMREHHKEGVTSLQLCLPKFAGYNLALKAHIASGRGGWNHPKGPLIHNGPRKLHAMLSQRFHFEGMKKACQQIHDECNICSETKDNPCKKRADAVRSIMKVTSPAQVWAIDELKLPPENSTKSPSVLVAVDLYSRFTIVIPIDAPATSEYIMQLLQWNIMMVHGRMRTLICDNCPNLSGQAMQQAVASLNVILRTTPIYSPRSNITENSNKYILKSLRIYHKNHQVPYSRWRHTMPLIVSAMNYSTYSGELGTKYGLSPAKLFYAGARGELDPANNFDLPYLAHVYKNHFEFVQHMTEAAWVNTQIVSEHRIREKNERAKASNHPHDKFSAHKTFNTGDLVLLDRHLVPGTLSKLRPRAQYKFVVLYETESSVFCRPWHPPAIETWCKAQKYTKQNKDAIIPLPVIKLPKELVRKDKTLALWTSRSRSEDKNLIQDSHQPDPINHEIEIETYPDSDWLDVFQIDPEIEEETNTRETPIVQEEPTERHIQFEETHSETTHSARVNNANETTPLDPQKPTHTGQKTPLPEPRKPQNQATPLDPLLMEQTAPRHTQNKSPNQATPPNPRLQKSILKTPNLRRSKRLAKKCSFNPTVHHSDGSNDQLKTHTIKHIRRILKFPHTTTNSLESLDREYAGHFHTPPSNSGTKITHIRPHNTYNRTCMCHGCSLQISECRQNPCHLCIETSNN